MKIAAILVFTMAVYAAPDKPHTAQAANDKIAVSAALITDKQEIVREIGSDLGGYFTVVRVEVSPKGTEALTVSRDDFMLHSYDDGQKTLPFAPSQIAGRGALVIGSRSLSGTMTQSNGPVWGGAPGTGGRPRQLPGSGGQMGSATSGASEATATVDSGSKQKEDPVLAVLKQKMLPDQKETREPMSGLLFFSLEGKHKPKNLVLHYTGPAGKLLLEFK